MSDFFTDSKMVKELKPSDFDSVYSYKLKSKKCTIVLFYCHWCPHCVKMKKDWESLGKRLGFCDVSAFHCAANLPHTDKIKEESPGLIKGYPTIIFYKDGSPLEKFDGERTIANISDMCIRICA